MKIKVGKYTLRTDIFSLWLTEDVEVEGKDGEKKIKENRVAGYCTSWDSLLSSFCRNKIATSDAETMEELLIDLEQTYRDMCALNDKVVKKDFERLKGFIKGE